MGYSIYSRDSGKLTETACPKRGPWFGTFMRGSKLRMGVIKKQDFRVTGELIKDLLEGWYTYSSREGLVRKMDISCLAAAVLMGLCGGLKGEKVFLTSLKEILKF